MKFAVAESWFHADDFCHPCKYPPRSSTLSQETQAHSSTSINLWSSCKCRQTGCSANWLSLETVIALRFLVQSTKPPVVYYLFSPVLSVLLEHEEKAQL